MTAVVADATHASFILTLLRVTPSPPNETEESIKAIIDDPTQVIYVDTRHGVVVRLNARPDEQDVIVIWWLWTGKLNATRHLPTLGMAVRAVKAALPMSGSWRIWGDFPGEGDTDVERKADSTRQADEHDSWLGGATTRDSKQNPKMSEKRSTVDAVIAATAAFVEVD